MTPPGPITLGQGTPAQTQQLLTAEVSPGFDGEVLATALQADGKLLVGGRFTAFNGISCGNLVRLSPNGALDASFTNLTGVLNDSVKTIVVQPTDQKILVGGYFTAYGTTACSGVVRLNTDGSRDASFNIVAPMSTTGARAYVATIAVQLDGKVVVGGYNFNSNSVASGGLNSSLARYAATGALDTGFQAWFKSSALVTSIALLGDQPQLVLAGGSMLPPTSVGGFGNYTLLVLNSSGGLRTSFGQFTGEGLPINSSYYAVTALAVANVFNSGGTYTGSNVAVARRHTDNSQFVNNVHYLTLTTAGMVATFGNGIATGFTAPNNIVKALAFQSDGKILLGGSFKLANGPVGYLARLSAPAAGATTLTQDLTFTAVPNGRVNALAVQSNAGVVTSIAVGGKFTSYNGTPRSRLARFNSAGVLDPSVPVAVTSYGWLRDGRLLTGETGNTYTVIARGNYQATATIAGATATSNTVVVNDTRDLTIRPPGSPNGPPTLIAGTQSKITVLENGVGKLTNDVVVLDSVIVRKGGTLDLGRFHLTDGTTFSNFLMQPGATLSVGDPAGITTSGRTGAVRTTVRSFADDASFVYTGMTNQATGNALPAQVRNLTDSTKAGAALTLSAATSISQLLTLASASNLNLDNKRLTLLSSASGTALVVNGPLGGRVTGGAATMERYIDTTFNAGSGVRYYSSPVAGATARSFTAAPTFANASIYDPMRLNTASSSIDSGLVRVADPIAPLEVGKGYAVNISANDKVSFSGALTSGPQALVLTRTSTGPRASNGGWNLVGNPYPAPLNWDLVTSADRPNLDAAIYTYVSTGPTSGFYSTYVNGWGDTPIIAAGQSFFVRVSDNPNPNPPSASLAFDNRQRVTNYDAPRAVFNRTGSAGTGVALSFSRPPGGTGGGKPPTVVYENAQAQPNATGFSLTTDAYRIPSTDGLSLSISAPAPEDELSIKALGSITSSTLVRLTARVPQPGNYIIQGITVQVPNGLTAFLDDDSTNTSVNLSNPPAARHSYRFTRANVPIIGRFVLRFGPRVVAATNAQEAMSGIALYPNPARNQVTVQIPAVPGVSQLQATLLNELGQVVRRQEAPVAAAGTRVLLNVQGLSPGVYAMRLQLGNASVVRRLMLE